MIRDELIGKIESRDAVVGVVGLGYVGLPLVLRFGEVGFHVVGFDVDPSKVEQLNKGQSYIGHVEETRVFGLRDSGRFEATSDFSKLAQADCVIICVPTTTVLQTAYFMLASGHERQIEGARHSGKTFCGLFGTPGVGRRTRRSS